MAVGAECILCGENIEVSVMTSVGYKNAGAIRTPGDNSGNGEEKTGGRAITSHVDGA